MRCYISVTCVLSVLIAISHAAPMPQSGQVIDNVIQNVTSTAFRVIGRVLLQQGGLGGGGGGGGEGGAGRVSVVLPDFGDDDDEDEDEESDAGTGAGSTPALTALEASSSVSTSTSSSTTTDSSISTRDQKNVISTSSTLPPTTTTESVVVADDRRNDVDSDNDDQEITITDARNVTNALALNEVTEKELEQATPETPAAPLFTSPSSNNLVDVNDIRVRTRRAADTDDQVSSASGGNSVAASADAPNPADDLANVEDDADRDKRFLPFGGSVSGTAGSGGGSGNFLFDIIRRTADGAARAAGTVFRLIAGTETDATAAAAAIDTGGGGDDTGGGGIGFSASSSYPRYLAPQLIAGSGATEVSDEQVHAPFGAGGVAEIDVAKATDAYTEGVPGPITRLFVLANRGLANLVQDLILRLAQTSERIVNFKARLVTALI